MSSYKTHVFKSLGLNLRKCLSQVNNESSNYWKGDTHLSVFITDRVLWSITDHFEDLRHFPSGPQVHPETRHGTPGGQADYTAAAREGEKQRGRKGRIRETLGPIFII